MSAVGNSAMDRDEYQALRVEIIARIQLQNLTLMLLMPLFLATSFVMTTLPRAAVLLALAYIVATGIGGLLWIHHAARTTQIKQYLRLMLEPRLRDGGGWERWHAVNRVAGLLGSRWRISTIGVFIGSDIAMLYLGWMIGPTGLGHPAMLLSLLAIGVSAVLLIPPRMSAEIRAQLADTA